MSASTPGNEFPATEVVATSAFALSAVPPPSAPAGSEAADPAVNAAERRPPAPPTIDSAPSRAEQADVSPEAKTEQRRAVDALATGDDVTALRLYDELASAHPDQPLYREAMRIIREKRAQR